MLSSSPDVTPDPDYDDVLSSRKETEDFCNDYEAKYPSSSYGYTSQRVAIPTRDGASILVKISQPLALPNSSDRRSVRPLQFVTHGGGWKEGTAAIEEAFGLRALLSDLGEQASMSNTDLRPVVVAPEYRFVPEHSYPIPVEDCIDALEWAMEHAQEYGADPKDKGIILSGGSAGAQLALVLALSALKGEVKGLQTAWIKGLLLLVPAVCHPAHWPLGEEPSSYAKVPEDLMGGDVARKMWARFVKGEPEKGDWKVSPFIGDLRGLPPTSLFVAGSCPFTEEGCALQEKLIGAGVKAQLYLYEGMPHMFAGDEDSPSTKEFYRDFFKAYQSFFS